MTDVLLSLTMPEDVAQEVEDLLLSRPDLVAGFTAIQVDGHGSVVRLVRADELVRGHSPRVQIQSVGDEVAMRKVVSFAAQRNAAGKHFLLAAAGTRIGATMNRHAIGLLFLSACLLPPRRMPTTRRHCCHRAKSWPG